MSDEQTPKRKGGWPAGKPRGKKTTESAAEPAETPVQIMMREQKARPTMLGKMKARPNWDSEDFVGVGMDGVDRLRIDPEVVQALARDGVALQWITKSVRGQEMPQETAKFIRGGWTPVHQSDFDGLLDGRFMPKGQDEPIVVDDCMLVARPMELQQKAQRAQYKDAGRPLQITEEQLGHGIPNVTGSNHKSVHNTIKKSMDRIEIPE
jgi:hypothetical protein